MTGMKHCITCKYWYIFGTDRTTARYGECRSPKFPLGDYAESRPEPPPDFGCTLHEPFHENLPYDEKS